MCVGCAQRESTQSSHDGGGGGDVKRLPAHQSTCRSRLNQDSRVKRLKPPSCRHQTDLLLCCDPAKNVVMTWIDAMRVRAETSILWTSMTCSFPGSPDSSSIVPHSFKRGLLALNPNMELKISNNKTGLARLSTFQDVSRSCFLFF